MPQATILSCTCIVRDTQCGRGPQCCSWATNQQACMPPVSMPPTETSQGGGAPCVQHHTAVQDTDTENQAHLVCQHKARHYCNCRLTRTGLGGEEHKAPTLKLRNSQDGFAETNARTAEASTATRCLALPVPAHHSRGWQSHTRQRRHKRTGDASRFILHVSRRTCRIIRKSRQVCSTSHTQSHVWEAAPGQCMRY